MAMPDLEVFKRRVGYRVRAAEDTFMGNSSASSFNLSHDNVFDVDVLLGGSSYPETAYTVESEAGAVAFTSAPDEGELVDIRYKYAPFTDTEANALITEYGVDGAVIEALREILAN